MLRNFRALPGPRHRSERVQTFSIRPAVHVMGIVVRETIVWNWRGRELDTASRRWRSPWITRARRRRKRFYATLAVRPKVPSPVASTAFLPRDLARDLLSAVLRSLTESRSPLLAIDTSRCADLACASSAT